MSNQDVWNEIFASRSWGKYPAEPLVRFIGRTFLKEGNVDALNVLELGCGPGANLWFLSREGFNAYGIDCSTIAINQAKVRMNAENLKCDLKVGNIEALPYAANFFDIVIDNACVYCNDHQTTKKIFSEIQRVLRADGYFFSITFADDTSKGTGFVAINELEFKDAKTGTFANAGYVRLTSRESMSDLYNPHFRLVKVEKLKLSSEDNQHCISQWIITGQKKD